MVSYKALNTRFILTCQCLNRTFMELKQSERIRHQLSAPVLIVPLWKETHFLRLKKGEAHNGSSV